MTCIDLKWFNVQDLIFRVYICSCFSCPFGADKILVFFGTSSCVGSNIKNKTAFWLHIYLKVILDVIKYCHRSRWYEKIPPGGETSIQRWDLRLEVRPPFEGVTSDQRWNLQLEVRPPFRGGTSNWRCDSDQRWDLHLEVGPQLQVRPPTGGHSSNWRSFLFWLAKR